MKMNIIFHKKNKEESTKSGRRNIKNHKLSIKGTIKTETE